MSGIATLKKTIVSACLPTSMICIASMGNGVIIFRHDSLYTVLIWIMVHLKITRFFKTLQNHYLIIRFIKAFIHLFLSKNKNWKHYNVWK